MKLNKWTGMVLGVLFGLISTGVDGATIKTFPTLVPSQNIGVPISELATTQMGLSTYEGSAVISETETAYLTWVMVGETTAGKYLGNGYLTYVFPDKSVLVAKVSGSMMAGKGTVLRGTGRFAQILGVLTYSLKPLPVQSKTLCGKVVLDLRLK
jgi:hypothetical protein